MVVVALTSMGCDVAVSPMLLEVRHRNVRHRHHHCQHRRRHHRWPHRPRRPCAHRSTPSAGWPRPSQSPRGLLEAARRRLLLWRIALGPWLTRPARASASASTSPPLCRLAVVVVVAAAVVEVPLMLAVAVVALELARLPRRLCRSWPSCCAPAGGSMAPLSATSLPAPTTKPLPSSPPSQGSFRCSRLMSSSRCWLSWSALDSELRGRRGVCGGRSL